MHELQIRHESITAIGRHAERKDPCRILHANVEQITYKLWRRLMPFKQKCHEPRFFIDPSQAVPGSMLT